MGLGFLCLTWHFDLTLKETAANDHPLICKKISHLSGKIVDAALLMTIIVLVMIGI